MEYKKAGEIIRAAREKLGLTKQELADRIGVSRGSVSQWELGLTAPKRNREDAVARVLGISREELFGRADRTAEVVELRPEQRGAIEIRTSKGFLVRVPRLVEPVTSTAATPAFHDDVLLGSIDLSGDWVTQRIRPSSIEALRVITAYGDAMSPTFADGDLLLIDSGISEIVVDGLYVIRAHGRLFVRRVTQRLDGSFVVSSDNPQDRTTDEIDRRQKLDVVGRVVWVWNGRKL